MVRTRLQESCRQIEEEVVSNSIDKFTKPRASFFAGARYTLFLIESIFLDAPRPNLRASLFRPTSAKELKGEMCRKEKEGCVGPFPPFVFVCPRAFVL